MSQEINSRLKHTLAEAARAASTPPLSERETATILAALRRYQNDGSPADPPHYFEQAGCTPLDSNELDELCERINCEFGAEGP